MKLASRTILAAIAFSLLAAPVAQAQQRYDAHRHGQHYAHPQPPSFHLSKKKQVHKPVQKRHHWAKGKRVPAWQRRQIVRDYHRYGLARPARGQQWVKVDDQYLLISLATGIIAGLVLNR